MGGKSLKKTNRRSYHTTKGLVDAAGLLLHISRFLLGAVFLFSGFVKAVDPMGTVFKIEDYLVAFGGFWTSLTWLGFPGAILLILSEWVIGVGLFLQIRMKLAAWLAFAFMLVMTPLTLYIAIHNPVTDCGCFGDAITLTNWQTFSKNVVFMIISIIVLVFNKHFKKVFLPHIEWLITGFFTLIAVVFMIYNLINLPIMDFRPYKVGVNIPEAMRIPEGAAVDEFEYLFTYEKDGVQQQFSLDALPDSTWSFVSQDTRLISKGYEPPLRDFHVLSGEFGDMTTELVEYPGMTYFFISRDLTKASGRGIEKIKKFLDESRQDNVRYIVLTAPNSAIIQEFEEENQLNVQYYTADPVTIKTIIRANPGILLLDNGTIKGKWNWRNFRY